MLRLLSFALAVVEFLMNMAPVTLWRFSVACIGFAIYLHLYAKDEH
jgi:hypothetical protein